MELVVCHAPPFECRCSVLYSIIFSHVIPDSDFIFLVGKSASNLRWALADVFYFLSNEKGYFSHVLIINLTKGFIYFNRPC